MFSRVFPGGSCTVVFVGDVLSLILGVALRRQHWQQPGTLHWGTAGQLRSFALVYRHRKYRGAT